MAKKLDNDFIDIDLSVTRKKKFRIDGDNNRILELNTSDTNIVKRMSVVYPKLLELCNQGSDSLVIEHGQSLEDDMEQLGNTVTDIDTQMRALLDELFESNVSEVCAPYGTMIDILDGEMRFEHIITTLAKLYENNFENEFKNMSSRMSKHTQKYTKK